MFEKAAVETNAKVVIGFEGQDDEAAAHIFDGPGGALAKVVQKSYNISVEAYFAETGIIGPY